MRAALLPVRFSSSGTALMLKLASMLKVRVHAASDFQWEADPYGFVRRIQGYDVDGSTSLHYMPPASFF